MKVRSGHGTFVDGVDKYEGGWAKDEMSGEGGRAARRPALRALTGRAGAGSMSFGSGASYEGHFLAGAFHGPGKYVWADGATYTGGWRANQCVGARWGGGGERGGR